MTDKKEEEFWNFYCYECKWKGVAQELEQDEALDEFWCCPICHSTEIEDMGWHRGNKKYTGE